MNAPGDAEQTIKLCEVDGLADGDLARTEIDGRMIAYARVGDDWFAIDDTCTHAKVSLADGIIDADELTIECPKHGAVFSLETGEALTLPAIKPIARHAVSVTETGVFITVEQHEENA